MGERWKMAESAPDMRRVERGGEWGNFWPNRTMQERVGRDIASVSWRQVLVSPADIRGHPRHARTEGGDGRFGIIRVIRENREIVDTQFELGGYFFRKFP